MKKYVAEITAPCPFHSASPQSKSWNVKCNLLICVSERGRVFQKHERPLEVYRAIGKWKEVNMSYHAAKGINISTWLDGLGAVECNFRGAPRLDK